MASASCTIRWRNCVRLPLLSGPLSILICIRLVAALSCGRCFRPVDSMLDGAPKLISIDEKTNHQVVHIPTVCLVVTSVVVYTYGCDDGRIGPTRCAVIDAVLGGRESPHRAYRTPRAAAGSARSALGVGSGPALMTDPGGSPC